MFLITIFLELIEKVFFPMVCSLQNKLLSQMHRYIFCRDFRRLKVRIVAGLSRGIPFIEFPSKRVKQSITGNGNTSKEQVMKMLQMIKLIDETPKYLDTWCWMNYLVLGYAF